MDENTMLTVGGIGGILAGILGFIWSFGSLFILAAPETALTFIFAIPYTAIVGGIFLIIHGIGFFGLSKKFNKGPATAAGVFAILYGICVIVSGAILIGALAAPSEELLTAITAASTSLIVALVFGVIFGILAIISFSGTEKGTLGLVGGILTLIGVSAIGLLLMGICMIMQSKL